MTINNVPSNASNSDARAVGLVARFLGGVYESMDFNSLRYERSLSVLGKCRRCASFTIKSPGGILPGLQQHILSAEKR